MEIDSNKLGKAGKPTLKAATKPRLTPSILSKLMICPAYISRQLSVQDRFRFLGFHALAVQKVIARHLKNGYILEKIEAKSGFGRIDLIFKTENSKRKRQVEVKSGKNIYLYAKYQTTLYWNGTDELVVSNSISDTVLPLEFIMNAQERAEAVKKLTNCYDEEERYASVNGVFKVIRKLNRKDIVLLDDTKVRGVTLLECAKELKKTGASDVAAICLGINK